MPPSWHVRGAGGGLGAVGKGDLLLQHCCRIGLFLEGGRAKPWLQIFFFQFFFFFPPTPPKIYGKEFSPSGPGP